MLHHETYGSSFVIFMPLWSLICRKEFSWFVPTTILWFAGCQETTLYTRKNEKEKKFIIFTYYTKLHSYTRSLELHENLIAYLFNILLHSNTKR